MALEEKLNKGKPVQMIQEEDPKEGLQCLASLSQGPQWDRALSLGVALLLPMWWQWLCLSIQKLCLKGTLSPAELTPSWKCWETGNLINLLGVIPDLLTLLSSSINEFYTPVKETWKGGYLQSLSSHLMTRPWASTVHLCQIHRDLRRPSEVSGELWKQDSISVFPLEVTVAVSTSEYLRAN